MRPTRAELAAGSIMVAFVLSAALAGGETVELDETEMQRAGVAVSEVGRREFSSRYRVVGQVVRTPGSTATIKAIVPGRVEELHAAPGEQVAAGEVLLSLHSHEMLSMQGDLLRAAERRRLAQAKVDAGRELLLIEGISRMELRVREEEAMSADLEFTTLREELLDHGLSEATVDGVLASREPDAHLPVASPIDGVVLELGVQLHEWVQDYAPLLVVGDPARIELDLQLPPDQVGDVAIGDPVRFAPVGNADRASGAVVTTQVPQVDPVTRTLRVRARITGNAGGLFPGVFVEGQLTHGAPRDAPSVPTSAVITIDSRDVVFRHLGGGRFETCQVRLGARDGDQVEVVDGLDGAERVATAGVFFLKSALLKGEDG